MGNCCGTSSNTKFQLQDSDISPENHEFLHHQQEQEEEEENSQFDDLITETTSPTRSNTPFQFTPLNEITTTRTTPTTMVLLLPLVDPRLVSLLDFFRHLSVRRKDVFDKIMPVHRQDFESIFNEMKKVQQLEKQNSKMGGLTRRRSLSAGDEDGLKMERFKVKPIDSGGIKPPPKDNKGGRGIKIADSKK
ncbi:AM-toxin synthetase AMT1 [Bienertia sinuspersici]